MNTWAAPWGNGKSEEQILSVIFCFVRGITTNKSTFVSDF